jgi:hypothetical protein
MIQLMELSAHGLYLPMLATLYMERVWERVARLLSPLLTSSP